MTADNGGGFEAWLARRNAERATAAETPLAPAAAVERPRTSRIRPANVSLPPTDFPDLRQAAVEWARAVMDDARVVFLDTETTGLGPSAEIIDIGIVDAAGTVLLNTLVKPVGRVPMSTTRVHGLYDHHLRHAPSWQDVYAEVFRLLAGARVIVYNAPFDSGMVTGNCTRYGLPAPQASWQCAMRQYASFAGPAPARPGRRPGRFYKLDRAAAAFGIAPGGHRALADADVCRRVVAGMASAQRLAEVPSGSSGGTSGEVDGDDADATGQTSSGQR